MNNGINNFREKKSGSIIILKMVNDPLRVRKENLSITLFVSMFRNNTGYNNILLVDDGKNVDGCGKVTKDI